MVAVKHVLLFCFLMSSMAATAFAQPGTPVTCLAAADGDDLWVEDAQGLRVRVRLLGIDAREWNEPGGPEAKAFLQAICEDSPTLYLEEDPEVVSYDPWGRNLRWVWTSDGRLVQRLIMDAGHAERYTDQELAHAGRLDD